MNVQFNIENGVGMILLDRADKVNALTSDMLTAMLDTLKEWETNDDVRWVLLEGSGKSFCAGGDLVETYNDGKVDPLGAMPFYTIEFTLDRLLYDYAKPLVVHYKGITMGGGIGLGCGADLIIADDSTRWAMPETRLGIIPDVGVGYLFSQLPRAEALYLSLCGPTIEGADLLPYKFATDYIAADDWLPLRDALTKLATYGLSYDDIITKLKAEVSRFHAPLPEHTAYRDKLPLIHKYFDAPTLIDLVNDLAAADDAFARQCHDRLRSASPFALAITFGKYESGKNLDHHATLTKDLRILELCWLSGNAFEGIRCTMIDKDDTPAFAPPRIEDVDDEFVARLLEKATLLAGGGQTH